MTTAFSFSSVILNVQSRLLLRYLETRKLSYFFAIQLAKYFCFKLYSRIILLNSYNFFFLSVSIDTFSGLDSDVTATPEAYVIYDDGMV